MAIEKPISRTALFVDGAARFRDLIYVIARDRLLQNEDVKHTRFLGFDQMRFGHNGDRNWSAVAVGVARKPAEKMVAIGEDGQVFAYVGGNVTEEQITPAPMVLRNVGVIEGLPYACGLNREVFRRDGDNSWTDMHAPGSQATSGFEAIDGFNANEIYAVGWNGEIWEWNGTVWNQHDSPSNLTLTGVCCTGENRVFACGQHGTLIVGRHENWEIVELGDFLSDFWDAHWFDGKLYLATMQTLFTYSDGVLEEVDFGDDAPATCYRLSSAENVLWSVGSSDIFCFDGTQWTRVD